MDYAKINEFVDQLINSNALKNSSLWEKEESATVLIKNNDAKLKVTFSLPGYYPGTDWETIKMELFKILGQVIAGQLKLKIQTILFYTIQRLVDFPAPDKPYREKILDFSAKLIARNKSRRDYGEISTFVESPLLSAYVNSIYQNKKYIYHGMNRFEGIPLKTKEEALDFLYTSLIMMPMYDISLPAKVVLPPQYSGPQSSSVSLKDVEDDQTLAKNFIQTINSIITKELPDISGSFLEVLTKAFFVERTEDSPIQSGLLKILYRFALDWKTAKKDKGADSFALSWLNVAE